MNHIIPDHTPLSFHGCQMCGDPVDYDEKLCERCDNARIDREIYEEKHDHLTARYAAGPKLLHCGHPEACLVHDRQGNLICRMCAQGMA